MTERVPTEAAPTPATLEEVGKQDVPVEPDVIKRARELLREELKMRARVAALEFDAVALADADVKHGDHDQSEHGNWASGGGSDSGGGDLVSTAVGGLLTLAGSPRGQDTFMESQPERPHIDPGETRNDLERRLENAGFTNRRGDDYENEFGERVTIKPSGDKLIVNQYEMGTGRLMLSELIQYEDDYNSSNILQRLFIEEVMMAEIRDQPIVIKRRIKKSLLQWLSYSAKHGDHDQSTHGSWASGGDGEGSSEAPDIRTLEDLATPRTDLVPREALEAAFTKAVENQFSPEDPRNGNPKLAVDNAIAHELANRYIAEGRSTQEIYEHNPETPGLYSAQREELHEEILENYFKENADVPNDREAVIVGGIFGAGKGYSQEQMGEDVLGFNPDDFATINPDDFKSDLIERDPIDYQGLKEGEQAGLLHEESSDLSKDVFQELLSEGKNIIFDYSMGSDKSLQQRLDAFREAGYTIRGVFVDTDPDDAARNAVQRWESPDDGRWVDLELYDQVRAQIDAHPDGFTPNRQVFENNKDKFDDWFLIGGSSRSHGEPELIGQGKGGST